MAEVSIIVPIYKAEQYLDQCVRSLLTQSFSDIEVILVDDGSPDGCPAICDAFAEEDPRVKVIHKANAGVSEARNSGLALVSGRFTMFIDSDDWLEPDAVETLLHAQETNDADLTYGDVYHVTDEKKSYVHVFGEAFDTEDPAVIEQLRLACIGYGYTPYPSGTWVISGVGSVWNKLYKTSIIRAHQLGYYFDTDQIFEDNLFTISYLRHAQSACYVSKPVYNYRMTPGSSIRRFRPDRRVTSEKIFREVHTAFQDSDQTAFRKAFYILVMRELSEMLRVYYFHPQNPKKWREKCRELKETICSGEYREAIRNVDTKKLMKAHKLTAWTAKTGSAFIMWLSYAVRSCIKRVLG